MKPPRLTRLVCLSVLLFVPVFLLGWAVLFLLVLLPSQPLLPETTLTTAQRTTHALVIYVLLISIPGAMALLAWGAWDYYRLRRDPEVEADLQARRAAAEPRS